MLSFAVRANRIASSRLLFLACTSSKPTTAFTTRTASVLVNKRAFSIANNNTKPIFSLQDISELLGPKQAEAVLAHYNNKTHQQQHKANATIKQGFACTLAVVGSNLSTLPKQKLETLLPKNVRLVFGNDEEVIEKLKDSNTDKDGPVVLLAWLSTKAQLQNVFRAVPSIAWVHSAMAGVNHILFEELVKSNVPMTNAKGAFSPSLGEWSVFSMLHFAKRISEIKKAQTDGVWKRFVVEELTGKRVTIVGYGDIGRQVALRARAFNMHITALRRSQNHSDPLIDQFLDISQLTEAMKQSDYVVNALPFTKQTEGLFSRQVISALPAHAVFINIGRGATVDEPALVEALQQKRIRGAALDVFVQEPLPAKHPFYELENVLLSAHCADLTPDYDVSTLDVFLDNLGRFVQKEQLVNVVDKTLGY